MKPTLQNKRNTPDRLELMKYNRFLRRHTLHKEVRANGLGCWGLGAACGGQWERGCADRGPAHSPPLRSRMHPGSRTPTARPIRLQIK